MRGRKPFARSEARTPVAPSALPRCPAHLSPVARNEWRRLASTLHEMGILTVVDRATLAAYCQCYARWVEAEQKLKTTPLILKTPSGYVQQSPWLSISNKQLELMGKYMAELGLTPSARQRLSMGIEHGEDAKPLEITFVTTYESDGAAKGRSDTDNLTIRTRPPATLEKPRITRGPIVIEDADKL